MALPDAAFSAALDEQVIRPVWLAWLDFAGDPVRASSGGSLTIASDDPELAGDYVGVDHRLVQISAVKASNGGSDTVTATLSGIPGLDDDTLAQIADPLAWRGRPARLWQILRDADGNQIGAVRPYYTGYMMNVRIGGTGRFGADARQTITVSIESYLATLTAASNRTYLDQERYDPDDLSARAAIAIANGNTGGAANASVGGGGGGGIPGLLRGIINAA